MAAGELPPFVEEFQVTESPAVWTSIPPEKLVCTTSKNPAVSVKLIDSLAVTAAPQVAPPSVLKSIVWPGTKLAAGNCWVELPTPIAVGLEPLKLYSQKLLNSELVIVVPVLF